MAITDQPESVTHPVPTSASTPAPDVDARALARDLTHAVRGEVQFSRIRARWLSKRKVDPNEPPLPAKITPDQAKALGEALARGEEHRRRIGLTIGRQLIDERTFSASPYGVTERVKEKVAGAFKSNGED